MAQQSENTRRKSGTWLAVEKALHRVATLNLRQITAAKRVASIHGHHARHEDVLQLWRLDGLNPNTFTAWVRSTTSLKGGGVPWVGILVYAAFVCGVAALQQTGLVDFGSLMVTMSDLHASGTLVAFLLGFLVNCAFERWWEGATKIVQAMTEFRNAAAHFASATKRDTPETQELYETITRLMLCIPHLIKHKLRSDGSRNVAVLPPAVVALLRPQERAQLTVSPCMVWGCVVNIYKTAFVRMLDLWLSERMCNHLEKNLNSLMRDLADCFKLVEMPLPFAYMAHIRKLLVLWLLAVPCVLMGEGVGWISLIYCLFLMFAMIGLERVSWQLENPFGLDPTDHKLEPRMTSAVLYCLMTCEVQDPAIWRAALTGLASSEDINEVVHSYVKGGPNHGEGHSAKDGTTPPTAPSSSKAGAVWFSPNVSHSAEPRQPGARDGRTVTWNDGADEAEETVITVSRPASRVPVVSSGANNAPAPPK